MGRVKGEDVAEAWEAYWDGCGATPASLEARNELMVAYQPLVRYVAGKLNQRLPSLVDYDDLLSYGNFGLADAISKFDAERGVKFETYAITRIRGAIIDELRATDWAPRSTRAKAKELEGAIEAVERRKQGAATDEEVAEQLGIEDVDYAAFQATAAFQVSTLEPQVAEYIVESDLGSPEGKVNQNGVVEFVASTMGQLDERSRTVLALYYVVDLTLAQIGDILGVTESRVCQIHTKAVAEFRERLVDRMGA